MTPYHYRCPHGHIIKVTSCELAPPETMKYRSPRDIAYCAFCEHKQTELVPVGPNRAETRQYCKTERIREAQDEC